MMIVYRVSSEPYSRDITGGAEQISAEQYDAYLAAYDAILKHAFFKSDGVSEKAAEACTGTCHVFPKEA